MIKTIKIFLCEDSIDGIFSAIYQAWSSNHGHSNIKIEENSDHNTTNLELFSEYIYVKTEYEVAQNVARSIQKKISLEAYEMICRVALSNHIGKADLIYRFLILGFHMGNRIIEHLSNEVVHNVFRINKYVSNEVHHFLGFVRFSEQENGLLTAVIHPRNNVLNLIMPHFADRLSIEKFIIYDENRNLVAFHVPKETWFIANIDNFNKEKLSEISLQEDDYQNLWKTFFKHIAIKERTNSKLQRNLLPLRFRDDMVEFK